MGRVIQSSPRVSARTYRQNLSWLNMLSEAPEKLPVRDVQRMQRQYEKAIGEIREELEYLKKRVEERR